MTTSAAIENKEPASNTTYHLNRIMLAHDGSPACERALEDSIALAGRFAAELVLARVEKAEEDLPGTEIEREVSDDRSELKLISGRLGAKGLRSRFLLRAGLVGDVLFRLVGEEKIDLLLLGAYGRGRQDRLTLGSTAELLLRAIPCPVLAYGPHASSGLLDRMSGTADILLPVNIPCEAKALAPAIAIAKLFGKGLHVLHVCAFGQFPGCERHPQQACEDLCSAIRQAGVPAAWSGFMGKPEDHICSYSLAQHSPLILFPLKRRGRLSSITSDNVAAKVIRAAHVPIMSYRLD